MGSLTKDGIRLHIYEDSELEYADVVRYVDILIRIFRESIKEHGEISVYGFGKFAVTSGRSGKKLVFTASRRFCRQLKEGARRPQGKGERQ